MWLTRLLLKAFGRAFAEIPDLLLWEWADQNVWLESREAAEAGPYRSAKTPWTRRLQELMQRSETWVWDFAAQAWIKVKVDEINVMKSSQSGYSEGALNGIRYRAQYRPCNVIYSIDTKDEARNISDRLRPSLEKLDSNVFTGDDDDAGTYLMRLRGMNIWFMGSFSSGKFANKQAPLVVADEVEEHGQEKKDTSSLKNLASRKKTAPNGLQINLSKPKLENGPIHKVFKRGNQEEYHVPCPHCDHMQWLTFFPEELEIPYSEEIVDILDEQTGRVAARLPVPLPLGKTRKITTGRLVFDHCKDLLGQWDKVRILRESYYECSNCKGAIREEDKPGMLSRAEWCPTALGSPGVISQHINDLYSTDSASTFGHIVLEFLAANEEGRKELQGFFNHRLGLAFRQELNKTDLSDIKANIAGREGDGVPPYRRGTIPFVPGSFLLGSDIGGNYAKWVVAAIHPNLEDMAIVDWGTELDPDSIADIVINRTWVGPEGNHYRLATGFVDAKYRKTETLKACRRVPAHRLVPCSGLGGGATRTIKVFAYVPVQNWPLKRLDFNDREAKDEFYVYRIKKKKRRCFFPIDVEKDKEFTAEHCAEELIVDENGKTKWNENPRANHFGDCSKLISIGLMFLTRKVDTIPRGEEAELGNE